MSRKLEDELGLPPMEDEVIEETSLIEQRDRAVEEARVIMSSLTASEKVDAALPTIRGLEIHDSEMDDISRKAVETYEELIALGRNAPVMYSCKVYEVAGQILKTAMDARDSKIDKKLKMLDLQMKKIKMDNDSGDSKGSGDGLDRNDIMSAIKRSFEQQSSSDDK